MAGRYLVSLRPRETPIPIGKIHAWILEIRDPENRPVQPSGVSVDGGMPQHGHGLITTPRVTQQLDEGVFLIEGVKFHMAGEWTLSLGISGPAGPDVARFTILVSP